MSNYGIRRYTTKVWNVSRDNEIIGTFNTEALAKEYVVFKKVADKMPDQSMSDGPAHYCSECGELEYADKPHNHAKKNRGEVRPFEKPASDQIAMSLTARLRREFASMFLGTSQNIRQAVKNKDIKDACDIIDHQAEQITGRDADMDALTAEIVDHSASALKKDKKKLMWDCSPAELIVDVCENYEERIKAKDEALKTVLRTRELVLPRKGHLVKAEHREEAAALAKMYASAEQALEGNG